VTGSTVAGTVSYASGGQYSGKLFCDGILVSTVSQEDVMETNPNYASFNLTSDSLSSFVGNRSSSFSVAATQGGKLFVSSAQSLNVPSTPWAVTREDDVIEAQLGEQAFTSVTYLGATSWTISVANSAGTPVFTTSGSGTNAYAA
jgi:hypothetical protein